MGEKEEVKRNDDEHHKQQQVFEEFKTMIHDAKLTQSFGERTLFIQCLLSQLNFSLFYLLFTLFRYF